MSLDLSTDTFVKKDIVKELLEFSWIVTSVSSTSTLPPWIQKIAGLTQKKGLPAYGLDTVETSFKDGSNPEPRTPLHLPPFPICHASNKVILLWWIHIHRRHCQGTCPWMRQGSVQSYQGSWLMFAESSTPEDPGNLRCRGCRGGKCFNKCVFFGASFSVSCKKCSWWSNSWSKSKKNYIQFKTKLLASCFIPLHSYHPQKSKSYISSKKKNNITYISTKRMFFPFKHLSPNVPVPCKKAKT